MGMEQCNKFRHSLIIISAPRCILLYHCIRKSIEALKPYTVYAYTVYTVCTYVLPSRYHNSSQFVTVRGFVLRSAASSYVYCLGSFWNQDDAAATCPFVRGLVREVCGWKAGTTAL